MVAPDEPTPSDGEGMHRHVDPTDGRTYLYAMSFLDAAPRWFGCFDQPDLKANFEHRRCAARPTGRCSAITPARRLGRPGTGNLPQPPSRYPTYFVTLVCRARTTRWTAEHDGIVLGLHARARHWPSYLQEPTPRRSSRITRGPLSTRYHELFEIRYPFGEYHQAFVPDFNAGAMENPGCVTLREQLIFPLGGDQRRAQPLRSSGDRARDGAHVVRRPGHHALVGRPALDGRTVDFSLG